MLNSVVPAQASPSKIEVSGSVLRHKMTLFGVKNFHSLTTPFHAILHTYIFPTVQEARQSDFVCKSYATHKFTFLFSHL